jgi:hypothetical protein
MQDALCALDQLAIFEVRSRARELAAQLLELGEAGDRNFEHRPDAVGLQAGDDVGGDARLHGDADRVAVAAIDEHHRRPRPFARDARHVLERVAVGTFHVDDDDVGLH